MTGGNDPGPAPYPDHKARGLITFRRGDWWALPDSSSTGGAR